MNNKVTFERKAASSLSQYAYVATTFAGPQGRLNDLILKSNSDCRELAQWWRHSCLQAWMENLWVAKGRPSRDHDNIDKFNGIELELTWEDLDKLELAVKDKQLPLAQSSSFGAERSDYYQAQDLEFIKAARAELFMGLRVFYNSSW